MIQIYYGHIFKHTHKHTHTQTHVYIYIYTYIPKVIAQVVLEVNKRGAIPGLGWGGSGRPNKSAGTLWIKEATHQIFIFLSWLWDHISF